MCCAVGDGDFFLAQEGAASAQDVICSSLHREAFQGSRWPVREGSILPPQVTRVLLMGRSLHTAPMGWGV